MFSRLKLLSYDMCLHYRLRLGSIIVEAKPEVVKCYLESLYGFVLYQTFK